MQRILRVAPRFPRELNSCNIGRNDGHYSRRQVKGKKNCDSEDYGSTSEAKGKPVFCLRTQKEGVEGTGVVLNISQTRIHVSPFHTFNHKGMLPAFK